MTEHPKPLPQLAGVNAYVPGEAPKNVGGKSYKLASNENPLGASPRAKQVYADLAAKMELYPDGAARELKAALAKKHGLDPARLVLGAGSDDIFLMLGRAYLGPGDESISTKHGFAIYAIIAQQQGAKVVEVAEKDFTADVDAILAAVTPKTKLVWLANPNNPTGTYLPYDEIKRLHAGLPSHVLLILDGAYAEFVKKNDYASGIELASQFGNVIMTRTFSKLYGLAGLRVGWSYAPPHVVDAIERVRMPFNVNLPAQAAAIAALEDDAFVEESLAHNERELPRLAGALKALGLEVIDGVGNFVVAKFPETGGKTAAEALAYLKERGVTVRGLGGYQMPNHLRISVGTVEGNDAALKLLREFLGVGDPMTAVFNQIAIIGVGLIGGSIARAALESGAADEVVLFDGNADALKRAGEIGFGRPAATIEEAVSNADAVFHCVPVGAMAATARASIDAMKAGAILTDVGSVKGNVARDFRSLGRADIHVIPGHPIAGTEKSGPDAGFATLFQSRWCILTPEQGGSAEYVAAIEKLSAFWTALGSKVEHMDAQRHDLVLAVTSHLPHLIAYNIVATAHDMEQVTDGEVVKFSAAGFRDFTRIAASDPTMWRDVFLNNREAVLEVLGRFDDDLTALRKAIRNGDGQKLFDVFTHARGIRREIIEAGQDTAAPNFGRDKSEE